MNFDYKFVYSVKGELQTIRKLSTIKMTIGIMLIEILMVSLYHLLMRFLVIIQVEAQVDQVLPVKLEANPEAQLAHQIFKCNRHRVNSFISNLTFQTTMKAHFSFSEICNPKTEKIKCIKMDSMLILEI